MTNEWVYRRVEVICGKRWLQVFPAGGGKAIYTNDPAGQTCWVASVQINDVNAGLHNGRIVYGQGLRIADAYADAKSNLLELQFGIASLTNFD